MSPRLLYQGQGHYLPPHPFAFFIFPWVQLKNLLLILYEWLARMIWAELWQGKTQPSDLVNGIAFLVFCFLAWGLYWVQSYAQLIFILSFMLWSLDWGLAIASYGQPQNRLATQLQTKDEQSLRWQTQSSHFPLRQATINRADLQRLSLERIEILGGAFDHVLGQPWQLSLILKDGSSYFLDHRSDLSILLTKADQLAAQLEIPLIFADSYGDQPSAAHPLAEWAIAHSPPTPAVHLQKSLQKWQVTTRWGWQNSGRMLQQILQESGFLLFLIFLANAMVWLGSLLNGLLAGLAGQTEGSPRDWVGLWSFQPPWGWGEGVEVALAVGVVLYNGWRLSQVRRVTVDRICVKYFINQRLICPLPTAQIDGLILLNPHDPELVVIAAGKALSLGSFQQPQEGLAFLRALTEAIAHFRRDFGTQVLPQTRSDGERHHQNS